MRKSIFFIIFILCAAAQLFLSVSSVVFNERVLARGEVHRFRTVPVDPYDPFRGKYVDLDFDLSLTSSDSGRYQDGEKVFVILERGADGYSDFSSISDTSPSAGNFIKMEIDYISGDEIYFNIPFDRYYIDEDYAEEAERAYQRESIGTETYIEVRVLNGRSVIEELFLGGLPVIDYLKS
ncbi:MAG: GDYXXLXY domain-containing protein [Spirochaetales bacterium]|nr:GDYXXLXY domain-containing protein [Spirochaetales bacterium]